VLAAVVVNTAVKAGLVVWLGSRRLAAPVVAVLLPAALVGLVAVMLV
jgi:uncharacterized membrane protein (DUF4010 family)